MLALMLVNGLREVKIIRADYGDLKRWVVSRCWWCTARAGEDETVLRDDVHQALMDYLETRGDLEPSSPLFVGVNHRVGKRMSTRTVGRRVDHYLKQAGLKREGIGG